MGAVRSMLLTAIGCAAFTPEVSAQPWPTRPVRVVVPIAAGSVTDTVPRLVFEQVSAQLGQNFLIENRPGAGSTIGTAAVARADPDGYTLLSNSSAHSIAPALYASPGYDASKDFIAVAPLGVSPFVLVTPRDRGFRTVPDLIAAAKAKPGSLTFASPGIGTASHLSAERFRLSAGIEAVHVPFRGGSEALTEIIAGRIDFFFIALGAALQQIKDGKVVALAVNGSARTPALPEVPTTLEAGTADAENPTWFGVFAPAATPPEVIERLHREVGTAIRSPKTQAKLIALGLEPLVMTTEEFGVYVRQAIASDAALVAQTKLKTQ